MAELTVTATLEMLDAVTDFINQQLDNCGCSPELTLEVDLAVEEIYVNIAHYAYHPRDGQATIRCTVGGEPLQITIEFLDSGRPYDPLKTREPDLTLSAPERQVGGLGIFMVKALVDRIQYEYRDGKNILTIQKKM